jgi:hypothetical protein
VEEDPKQGDDPKEGAFKPAIALPLFLLPSSSILLLVVGCCCCWLLFCLSLSFSCSKHLLRLYIHTTLSNMSSVTLSAGSWDKSLSMCGSAMAFSVPDPHATNH